jgi:hypothetical protein
VAAKLVRQIPVVGPIAAGFIERPVGMLLDAARKALLKKAQPEPALAASAAKQAADTGALPPAEVPALGVEITSANVSTRAPSEIDWSDKG